MICTEVQISMTDIIRTNGYQISLKLKIPEGIAVARLSCSETSPELALMLLTMLTMFTMLIMLIMLMLLTMLMMFTMLMMLTESNTSLASLSALMAFCSPSAAIT